MPRCFIGYWTNNLTDAEKKFLPIGVVVREKDSVDVRLIGEERLPDDYKPKSLLSKEIFKNLEAFFRDTRAPSDSPTNLYFTEVIVDTKGSSVELADRLFSERVLPHYMR